jgi:hypothetical protein
MRGGGGGGGGGGGSLLYLLYPTISSLLVGCTEKEVSLGTKSVWHG